MWSTERPHLCVISFYPTLSASFDCCDEFVYTWHRSQRALKETLESLPPNQSVSPFTCWSICVLICLRPGSPRWTVINVEDERGSPVLFSLLLHALAFKCICTLNDEAIKSNSHAKFEQLLQVFRDFWSADSACVCCGLLSINMAIRRVHLSFKSGGGSVTFGPLWPDYTFHLKAQRTKPAMWGSQTDLLLTEELHNTAKICTCIYTKESMYEAGHSSVGWPPA